MRCYFCATKRPSLWENEGQSLFWSVRMNSLIHCNTILIIGT
nr:MAG TPA: hypothetical protein [Caudoviricetes sp.]